MRLVLEVVDVLDELPYPHAAFVLVLAGALHVAVEVDDVLLLLRDVEDLHEVRLGELEVLCRGEAPVVEVYHDLPLVLHDPLHLYLLGVGGGEDAAGELDDGVEVLPALELVDGGPLHVPRYPHQGARDGYEDDVPRLEHGVPGLVPLEEEVVEVEGGDEPSLSLELDAPQGTDRRRSARDEECVGDGREGADRVGPGARHVTEDEHGDGLQPSHGDVDAGADDLLHLLDDVDGHLLEGEPRDGNGADLGYRDVPVLVHHEAVLGVHPSPEEDLHLVPGTDHVVGGDGDVLPLRDNLRRGLLEEVVPEGRKVRGDVLVALQALHAVE
ncbi:MAG: hypothetical protein A4E60_02218 [Syntrophorhabdus sp. PtaB.Bin047]|nr:MAG: hypothetical protein A4E60_02218 [Syntrophorhabdus sp. PtaB.Bin047]